MSFSGLRNNREINQVLEKIEDSESLFDDYKAVDDVNVPDGGWGWVVVFGCFMVHFISDGVTYSFGVLATELISHFEASRESIGWMVSILVGMTFITGPFVSILCNKYGFRAVTMTGAVVSSIGFSAPFFYSEIWFIYVSASVITGIGFCLVYLPSIVMVNIYFKEKRSFAIGLAVCGSGIGTFVFSPLIEYFNENYCWQGSMLLVGGLILNCLACGAVYIPLTDQTVSSLNPTPSSSAKLTKLKDMRLVNNSLNKDCISVKHVKQRLQFEKDVKYFNSAPEIQRMHHTPHQAHKKIVSHHLSSQMSCHISHGNLQENYSNDIIKIASNNPIKSDNSIPNISSNEIKLCLNNLFDKNLLSDPTFLIFAFSNFFNSIGFNAPFLYAKDRALEMGISNNYASFLISSIGIGNTLGRVFFGYLSSKSFVSRLQLYNGSLTLSGFVVIFSMFAMTYPWMIVYTMAFGILTGTYVTLTSVVLVDLLGIARLNSAFGMIMIFQGSAIFIGPPLAGWIFDQTKSFDWSFGVCGGFLAIRGIMLYFIYCSKDFRKKENI